MQLICQLRHQCIKRRSSRRFIIGLGSILALQGAMAGVIPIRRILASQPARRGRRGRPGPTAPIRYPAASSAGRWVTIGSRVPGYLELKATIRGPISAAVPIRAEHPLAFPIRVAARLNRWALCADALATPWALLATGCRM